MLKKFKIFNKYKSVICSRPNYLLIPVTVFSLNDEDDVKEFNKLYTTILSRKNIGPITRTPSGGITTKRTAEHRKYDIAFDIKSTQTLIELTCVIALDEPTWYRFQITSCSTENKKERTCGRKAFTAFKKICKKHNINLDDFAISKEEGLKEKSLIEKPMIKVVNERYKTDINGKPFENCHHLDFKSSYMSGLIKHYPIFEEPVKEIFNLKEKYKKENDPKKGQLYKDILNMTYGFMQSKMINFKYAHLSRVMLADNNERIREMSKRLALSGRRVLAYNTDGIWYQGNIYHDKDEGQNLLQWENDHINCTLRFKSDGAYEFIEDGKYHPVIRGKTTYERIVPREQWVFGDIYKGTEVKFNFVEGIGVVKNG